MHQHTCSYNFWNKQEQNAMSTSACSKTEIKRSANHISINNRILIDISGNEKNR